MGEEACGVKALGVEALGAKASGEASIVWQKLPCFQPACRYLPAQPNYPNLVFELASCELLSVISHG
jgi:hypothetical protein